MVVSVHYKVGKSLSRFSPGRILGDSLLVRARTTSFAVLGASAAIGIAVLAIALQEEWPLVPGSPPPRPVAGHTALGEATAVSAAKAPTGAAGGGGEPGGNSGRSPRGVQARHSGHRDTSQPTGSVTAPTSELVVAPSVKAPEPRSTGGGRGAHPPRSTAPTRPVAQKPKPAPTVPAPAPAPPAATTPPPSPPPAATVSAAPPEQSNVPPWSNGQGHAYGREDGGHGHDE
jgi:hypothetical protein